ncbi:MAG: DUF4405 domain-containing protein [bacterium]|nr:DUF4405 domain-containing protein [bacterium]
MTKPKHNFIVDALMAISFLVLSITGLVVFFLLPSGQRSGQKEVLGIIRHTWTDVHGWVGIVLIVLVLIHLILHYKWIVSTTKSIFSRK